MTQEDKETIIKFLKEIATWKSQEWKYDYIDRDHIIWSTSHCGYPITVVSTCEHGTRSDKVTIESPKGTHKDDLIICDRNDLIEKILFERYLKEETCGNVFFDLMNFTSYARDKNVL